jgi:hypothetical protein
MRIDAGDRRAGAELAGRRELAPSTRGADPGERG